MTTTRDVETNVWLEKARSIAQITEQHRDEGERERRLPQPIYEAMRDAGLYSLLLPKVYGGGQADQESAILVVEEISRQDGAVGWNLMIGIQGAMFADYLPDHAAQEIYGGGRTIVAGNFAPTGKAVPEPGGYRISGRWTFASGCRHANWMICGCMITENGAPKFNKDGTPQIYLFLIPATYARIIDTWHTGGLRGTGSNDFEVSDVFVPQNRGFFFPLLGIGPPPRANQGFAQPFLLNAGPSMAAVALGIARDAIDSFKALAAEKTPTGSSSKLLTQHAAHEHAGLAEALLGSARIYLLDANAQLQAGPQPSPDVSALVRLASAYAVRAAGQAVDLLYELGGGTSIYNRSRLDRCFRDVHTVSHHVLMSPTNIEMVGQYLLGGPLQIRR